MKIAIVGAGLYGCYLAKKFASLNIKVDLYEKNQEILKCAATNNQSRLHYGFHYPRSKETIAQTIHGSKIFAKEMSRCIFYPKENYYAVHQNSIVNFDTYLQVMDEFKLSYKHLDPLNMKVFAHPSEIEGVINTNEGVIILSRLEKIFLEWLKNSDVVVKTGTHVTNIDSVSGQIHINGKSESFDSYDWVINTTYTNPNLGLSEDKKFNVKYELTGMALLNNKSLNNTCVTIMDGDFVSLYSRDKGLYTLSSVKYTPIKRLGSFEDFVVQCNRFFKDLDHEKHIDLIVNDASKYLASNVLTGIENKMWISPKVKIKNDHDASRVSSYIQNGKVLSVMCGKIDVIPLVYSELRRVIV